MESDDGDVLEIKIGASIFAAFCNISELILPVVIKILFCGKIFGKVNF